MTDEKEPPTYRPDHNGECLTCDEPLDAHVCPTHVQELEAELTRFNVGEHFDRKLLARVQELEASNQKWLVDYGIECAKHEQIRRQVQELEVVITQHTRLRADLLIRIDELEREVAKLRKQVPKGPGYYQAS